MTKKNSRTAAKHGRFWVLTCLCLAFLWGRSSAQETAAPMDAETAKALLQHVKDLESQVNALKIQVQDLAEKRTNAPESAQLSTSVSEPPTAAPAAMPGHGADAGNGPRLQLRGYGDVGWNTSDQKGSTNSFALGQFNLFITSRLTDRASFLSETVIEADEGNNQFGIDLERLELIYAVNDRLNLQFGRYHTGIGFYSTSYHHSALMQTTLGRPFLFDFEDHGGIVPVHSVGMSATGTVSSKLGLHYIAEIGNGRNPRSEVNPVQSVSDDNNGKAFNLGFFARPSSFPGLQFGFSNYHDHVTPSGKANVTENILFAHAVYQNSRFEFLNEAVLLRHAVKNRNLTTNIPGFYSQISKQFGRYRPYLRYEYVNVPASDPLYSDVGLLHGPKAGLRFDLNEFAALKLEYGRDMRRGVKAVNRLGTQLSFAF